MPTDNGLFKEFGYSLSDPGLSEGEVSSGPLIGDEP